MGDMGGASLFGSDIFGGAGIGSLLSGGGASFDPSSVDPMTAMMMGSDPTGSMDAMAAITGNYGQGANFGPAGAPDLGGSQSGAQAPATGTAAAAPQAPQAPQPQTAPSAVPPMVAAIDTSQGPFSPQQQANVPGPTGFTPAQQIANRTGNFTPATNTGAPTPSWAAPVNTAGTYQPFAGVAAPQSTSDYYAAPGATFPGGDGGTTGAAPATDGTDGAPAGGGGATKGADGATPGGGTVAGGTKPGGAPGAGGMPNIGGMGNIMKDIMGLMSGNPQSLGSLIQDLMRMSGQGGQGGHGGQVATQGPYAGRPISQVPWATPQQIQQYRQTGQLPTQTPGQAAEPPAPAGTPRQVATQTVTGPGTVQQQAGMRPTPQGAGSEAQTPRSLTGGAAAPAGTTPTVGMANAPGSGATTAAPSLKSDGTMPSGRSAVTPIVASTLRAAGLPPAAIQGILYNIGRESNFNPSTRHFDQPAPQWRGTEAQNAHGLYQEGADTWNQYSRWLGGRDWRDPKLQTQFLAQNLKTNYPRLWNQLRSAQSPEQAAAAFAAQYLRPSNRNLVQRLANIRSGGVRSFALPAQMLSAFTE